MGTPQLKAKGATRFATLLSCLSLLGISVPNSTFAAANITVTPSRVILEGRVRSASVSLINKGDETSTFRISFERKRMTEDGAFEHVKTAREGELFADTMIRYSPRQVVLPPGQSQVVRLMLRKPANLPAGEYRSHLLFREVPKNPTKGIAKQSQDKKTMSITLTPVLGISIPVIVRNGKTEANISLTDGRIAESGPDGSWAIAKFKGVRTGNRSIYGDIEATFRPTDSSAGIIVAQVAGVAVYTPNTHRNFALRLQAPKGIKLSSGSVDIVFKQRPDEGNKTLSKITIPISGAN